MAEIRLHEGESIENAFAPLPPKNIRPTRILLGWQKKSSLEISRFKSQKLTLVICSARSAELNPFKSSRIAIPDARKVSALYR